MTVIVGLGFPQKTYLQNTNVCLNNILNLAGSKKCKRISEIAEKLRTAVKKTRESGYSASSKL